MGNILEPLEAPCMLTDGRQIWQIEDCESGILLICDRRQHEGEHHVRLPSGMRVWWSNGVVSAATDACGVAQSLLPKSDHAPVRLDAQGLNTKQTKQRRTNRTLTKVVGIDGRGRNWYALD
jgi:hypothetical protein